MSKEFYQDDDDLLWAKDSKQLKCCMNKPPLSRTNKDLDAKTKKPQPLKLSIAEAITNQILSFVIGVLIQITIFPTIFDINVSLTKAIPISIMFMVIGGLRSLLVRRFFTRLA